MNLLDHIAEERILAAIKRGEFDHLEGAGKPLNLDDDRLVPPALRMAFRILKNAGFVPPEVEMMRDARELERAIALAETDIEKRRLAHKLSLIESRLAARGLSLRLEPSYAAKLSAKLEGRQTDGKCTG
jgi:hypothetical protein